MKKLPICKICKERKVKQEEWKKPEEKELCFTCHTFKKYCELTMDALQIVANQKGINRQVAMSFIEHEMTPDQMLVEAIRGGGVRVFIKDKVIPPRDNIKHTL